MNPIPQQYWHSLRMAENSPSLAMGWWYSRGSISGPALASETALLGELKRNLAVYAGPTPGQGVQTLYVAEGTGPGGRSGRIAAGLPISVQSFDPLQGAAVDVPPSARGAFAGAAGVLELKARGLELPVNLLAPREPRTTTDPNQRKFLLLGFLAVVMLAGGIVYGMMEVENRSMELNRLIAEKNKLDNDLKEMEEPAKRMNLVDEWQKKSVNCLDELNELTAKFPTNIDGTQILSFKVSPSKSKDRAAFMEVTLGTEGVSFVEKLTSDLSLNPAYKVSPVKPATGQAAANPGGRGARRERLSQAYTFDAEIAHREPSRIYVNCKCPRDEEIAARNRCRSTGERQASPIGRPPG